MKHSSLHLLMTIPIDLLKNRDDLENITAEVEGKTFEEIEQYAQVFWERHQEIADSDKIVGNIEKGEQRIQKQEEIQLLIRQKVSKAKLPLTQLKFNYGGSKGKNYTEEEDRFLLVMLDKYGYSTDDVYERIRQEVKRASMFRFDWFLKSRTAYELSRRCATLITLIQKEFGEPVGGIMDKDGNMLTGRGRAKGVRGRGR